MSSIALTQSAPDYRLAIIQGARFINSNLEFKYTNDAVDLASTDSHICVLDWFKNSKTGGQSLLDQAQRQIKAANGVDIEWNFSSQKTLDATKSYLESQGVTKGITFNHTSQQ